MQQWHELETLKGYSLQARDGDIGKITDVWFDDDRWTVRYLVVRTGGWLSGRKVLLAPGPVQANRWADGEIVIDMECETLRTAPEYAGLRAIDKSHEMHLYQHYGVAPKHARAETA